MGYNLEFYVFPTTEEMNYLVWKNVITGIFLLVLKIIVVGHLGGSVVECLLLAQVVILGSWDGVPHRAPRIPAREEPASPSAYVSASFSVTVMNKLIKYFFKCGK